MKNYEQRIALIDKRIEWLHKVRVKIAHEQPQETNHTIVNSVSKPLPLLYKTTP